MIIKRFIFPECKINVYSYQTTIVVMVYTKTAIQLCLTYVLMVFIDVSMVLLGLNK